MTLLYISPLILTLAAFIYMCGVTYFGGKNENKQTNNKIRDHKR